MLIWLKAFLLIGASISFALGITLPLMRFESFYVFSTDASLIEVVVSLWDGGDGALAAVVALVSIVFPFVAIVIFATKTSGLAQAFTQPGLWFYAGSSLAVVALSALGRRAGIQKT